MRALGLVNGEREIGEIVVKVRDGTPAYLRDVERIMKAPALRFGAVTRDGREVVLGMTGAYRRKCR